MIRITLAGKTIGPGAPCYVIAEAGSNHNGDLDRARELIDVAAAAGADAVKFQLFRAARMYPKSAGISDYLKSPDSIYDIIERMEMPYDWLPALAEHSRQRSIAFLATPFDEESVDRLEPFVEAFKLASYEMTHIPLVEHVARKGKPIILSTGTATLDEIARTVDRITAAGNRQLALLQCTAAYPAPLSAIHVRAMNTIAERFDTPVGLSDHSRDPLVAPIVAVARGAAIIEKHFTLSNALPGPDHRFALEPDELRLMIAKIRDTEAVLGDARKLVDPVEDELRRFARRSIFATHGIPAGTVIAPENVAVLRCGKRPAGLAPEAFPAIIGRRAARDIAVDSALTWDDLQ